MTHRKVVSTRMLAALEAVGNIKQVDTAKVAAMGYCFGGLCVLDLARTGADVKEWLVFHGLLTAPEENVCKKIKAKILVLHGYDDPMVPPSQVKQFAQEMTTKKLTGKFICMANTACVY